MALCALVANGKYHFWTILMKEIANDKFIWTYIPWIVGMKNWNVCASVYFEFQYIFLLLSEIAAIFFLVFYGMKTISDFYFRFFLRARGKLKHFAEFNCNFIRLWKKWEKCIFVFERNDWHSANIRMTKTVSLSAVISFFFIFSIHRHAVMMIVNLILMNVALLPVSWINAMIFFQALSFVWWWNQIISIL